MNQKIYVFFSSFSVALLFACSHVPVEKQVFSKLDVEKAIQNLSTEIESARSDQLDVLSPYNFEHCILSLSRSQEDLKLNLLQKSSDEISTARLFLKHAHQTAEIARNNIDDVILARKQALDAHANQYFPDEFAQLDLFLGQICRDLEGFDMDSAIDNRVKIRSPYLLLELLAIKAAHLKETKKLIDQAISEGAPKFAKDLLLSTNALYSDVDTLITKNRHSKEIESKSEMARAEARQLLKVTLEASQKSH